MPLPNCRVLVGATAFTSASSISKAPSPAEYMKMSLLDSWAAALLPPPPPIKRPIPEPAYNTSLIALPVSSMRPDASTPTCSPYAIAFAIEATVRLVAASTNCSNRDSEKPISSRAASATRRRSSHELKFVLVMSPSLSNAAEIAGASEDDAWMVSVAASNLNSGTKLARFGLWSTSRASVASKRLFHPE